MSISEAIGIDIGTTFTRIACHRGDPDKTPIEVIQNKDGDHDIPSVVANDNGHLIAGREALIYSRQPAHADQTIYNVKLLLSPKTIPKSTKTTKKLTRNSSVTLITQKDRMPSKISFGSESFTPSQLLDPLLEIHVDSFRKRKSKDPQRCTIAVPAHFGKEERMAVEASAKRVGFKQITIVNESTAAVVQYQSQFKTGDGRYLVINCSAIGCDATLVEAKGSQYTTKGMALLQGYAGDDLDKAIRDLLIKRSNLNKDTITHDKFSMESIDSAIQEQKPNISRTNSVHFFTSALKEGNPINVELSTTTIETQSDNLIENFYKPITDLIRHQGIDSSDPEKISKYVQYFVITGGTSQLPFYKNKILEICGIDDDDDIKYVDSKTAVATGAALIDEMLLNRKNFSDVTIGIKPILYAKESIGISVSGDDIQELYETVIPFPDKRAFLFQTSKTNQQKATFNILYKASKSGDYEQKKSISLDGLPENGTKATIRFVIETITTDDIKVKVQAKGTPLKNETTFSIN